MFANACQQARVKSLKPYSASVDLPGVFELCLELNSFADTGWEKWRPGQFVMVRPVNFNLEYLWARPFSIYKANESEGLKLFFQIAGRGTERLARLTTGALVDIWGPLGNAFAIEKEKKTLILAGGIGIAPFVEYITRHPAKENLHLLFGHRPPIECYPWHEIENNCSCQALHETCTEDLQNFIARLHEQIPNYLKDENLILACGPLPFLKTIKTIADTCKGRVQLSLENKMACGVGACLGCVTEHKDEPVSVCQRGPIFWSDQLRKLD